MNPYNLEFAFEKAIRTRPIPEKVLMKLYTGNDISETDAKRLWQKISDHKWYVSETLQRDVGFHVAAIDYVENFYQPAQTAPTESRLYAAGQRAAKFARRMLRNYFEAKAGVAPL
jgi:hypothetical protein